MPPSRAHQRELPAVRTPRLIVVTALCSPLAARVPLTAFTDEHVAVEADLRLDA
jgi:hypothetical protein